MFVRCAYFTGHPVPGKESQLQAELEAALPMYMDMPHIVSANLLMSREAEEGAPGIHAMLQMEFASPADLEDALKSPARQRLRQHFVDVVFPLFEGSITHINHSQTGVRQSGRAG